MTWLTFLFVGLLLNAAIGTALYAFIDQDPRVKGRLFEWYKTAPSECVRFAVLSVWPVILFLWLQFIHKNPMPKDQPSHEKPTQANRGDVAPC